MPDEVNLEELTQRYWREWSVEEYIQNLLPKELAYLRENGRINVEPTEILVQTVGFSWEPLLISLCSYEPKTVVLILNKWYGKQEGAARGDKYKELVNKLKSNNLITKEPGLAPTPWETAGEKPVDVFKFLQRHILPLLNEGKRVVIDITGAKKSMVSGAYLFAVYTDTPVSYVDFDKFDEERGRPYGYTCKIDELKNPMKLFRLGEWDRVRQLYEQYSFWRARDLIKEIKSDVWGFLGDKELKSIDFLMEWLEFYGLWDDGDYHSSWKFKETKGISDAQCPIAVVKLGKIWPQKNELKKGIESLKSRRNIENSIYNKDEEAVIYAKDELAKIKRLVEFGEDYRSALLRAAGLNEFLFKARLIRSWINNKFVIEDEGYSYTREDLKSEDKSRLHEIEDAMLKSLSAGQLLDLLQSDKSHPFMGTFGRLRWTTAYPSDNRPILNNFWNGLKLVGLTLPDDIFELRNEAIHFCLSVPKEVAEVVVNFCEKNLQDFEKNWTKKVSITGKFEAMKWEELCDLCGIDFLPKMRRDRID
ncbi:MAG: hypothetical protein QXR19_11195 [Candidatus Jordarchaeaceae archaeon]